METRMTKRLTKDLESIQKNYKDQFTVVLPNNDLKLWHIKIKGADFSSKINTTPKVQINESHYDTVKAQLIKQYNFIKNHFPKQDLEIWSYK